ncbi:hypothetical protein RK21_02044 [Pseudomonas plecoglossicida]|nr:hypothetical protein RK21_02044 [Pseudomonas plecoglossicida]
MYLHRLTGNTLNGDEKVVCCAASAEALVLNPYPTILAHHLGIA